jgi:hypothetical protein
VRTSSSIRVGLAVCFLSLSAPHIARALPAVWLEITPDSQSLPANSDGKVQVSLNEAQASDLDIVLSSADPTVVSVPHPQFTISAGKTFAIRDILTHGPGGPIVLNARFAGSSNQGVNAMATVEAPPDLAEPIDVHTVIDLSTPAPVGPDALAGNRPPQTAREGGCTLSPGGAAASPSLDGLVVLLVFALVCRWRAGRYPPMTIIARRGPPRSEAASALRATCASRAGPTPASAWA